MIGADGEILNYHRKPVPTFYEKLIWTNGTAALRKAASPDGISQIAGAASVGSPHRSTSRVQRLFQSSRF